MLFDLTPKRRTKPRKRAHFRERKFRNLGLRTHQRPTLTEKRWPTRGPFRVLEGPEVPVPEAHSVFHCVWFSHFSASQLILTLRVQHDLTSRVLLSFVDSVRRELLVPVSILAFFHLRRARKRAPVRTPPLRYCCAFAPLYRVALARLTHRACSTAPLSAFSVATLSCVFPWVLRKQQWPRTSMRHRGVHQVEVNRLGAIGESAMWTKNIMCTLSTVLGSVGGAFAYGP